MGVTDRTEIGMRMSVIGGGGWVSGRTFVTMSIFDINVVSV